jgi:Tfp pilus assembly protein FimT
MFIALLLMVMAVPAFSKLARTSKIDQAVRGILTNLYHARARAREPAAAHGTC